MTNIPAGEDGIVESHRFWWKRLEAHGFGYSAKVPKLGGDAIFYGVLSEKAGADIRKVWTPTAENLFKRVSGPMLETIYCDLLDLAPTSAEAKAFAKLKKTEKAKTLEDLFSDETKQKLLGVTAAQKARIEAWVPDYYD